MNVTDIINTKFTYTTTNEKKMKFKEKITSQVVLLGVANRSIKKKLTNLHLTGKFSTNFPRETLGEALVQ